MSIWMILRGCSDIVRDHDGLIPVSPQDGMDARTKREWSVCGLAAAGGTGGGRPVGETPPATGDRSVTGPGVGVRPVGYRVGVKVSYWSG